jgi:hypothetical protein
MDMFHTPVTTSALWWNLIFFLNLMQTKLHTKKKIKGEVMNLTVNNQSNEDSVK